MLVISRGGERRGGVFVLSWCRRGGEGRALEGGEPDTPTPNTYTHNHRERKGTEGAMRNSEKLCVLCAYFRCEGTPRGLCGYHDD